MPTILRIGGLRIVIYPNDHRPPHVHVIVPGTVAVFLLNCPEGPPELRESYGFSTAELNRIVAELSKAMQLLCDGWRRIHGDY